MEGTLRRQNYVMKLMNVSALATSRRAMMDSPVIRYAALVGLPQGEAPDDRRVAAGWSGALSPCQPARLARRRTSSAGRQSVTFLTSLNFQCFLPASPPSLGRSLGGLATDWCPAPYSRVSIIEVGEARRRRSRRQVE